MKLLLKSTAAAATLAMLATPTQAACWNQATFEAAQVRELETMLMVGAMRCMQDSANFSGDYNAFVRNNSEALKGAGETLRSHFASEFGPEGRQAYHNFVSGEADRFMGGAARLSCQDLGTIARMAANAGSTPALVRFATAAEVRPAAPAKLCREEASSVMIAARR
ncbi:hypothetical protein GON01_02480 [Sphingomonas sp. MAH-20]|uniref:S-adenosyl-L-homocysteine hydrolase n=1 Tax=Sphingomonas horti TaxID=2682842 RepID=A0A6I4IXW4_9SPHN|nr:MULTISPECIES: hypothetical protein [Sphingomonas]MBA2920556.1 hypothetical protein [Sphingomonas sp. CGMCC 1.13658]MVO76808.1 hypothetical protein [Sphingomonas horti]